MASADLVQTNSLGLLGEISIDGGLQVGNRAAYVGRADWRRLGRIPGTRWISRTRPKAYKRVRANQLRLAGTGSRSRTLRLISRTVSTSVESAGVRQLLSAAGATGGHTEGPGCSTATSGVGSTTTAGTTNRLATRPCDTSTLFWLDGRIGSSSPCDVIGDKQRTGSLALRGDNRRCSPTGAFAGTRPDNGSRMRQESRLRFCERAAVRFHRATHLIATQISQIA
jgi:hypothetical protein